MRLTENLHDHAGAWFEGTPVDRLQTPFQLIEVFDTPELGKLMRIDGANMVSEKDEFLYHENLVHPAAIAHDAPASALIVGGGDGGTARELLKHPTLTRVLLAELDGGVIEMAKKHFPAVAAGAFDDPRLEIALGDGLARLHGTAERFDLVYLDLTDPVGPAEALYTRAFYADCRRALAPGGMLVMHVGSPFSHRARVEGTLAALRAEFARAVPYFVHIPMYAATWGFAVAAAHDRVATLTGAEVEARLAARGIGGRRSYNGDCHRAMLALPEYLKPLR